MALRTIEIDDLCDIEPGNDLLDHAVFKRVFDNWKKTKDAKAQGYGKITVDQLKLDPDARCLLRDYFENRFMTALPAAFRNIARVIDETEELFKSLDLTRFLSHQEIIDRLAPLGVDVEKMRREREAFYIDMGFADILEVDKYDLDMPELTEQEMKTMEELLESGAKLAIIDFQIPLEQKMEALIDVENAPESEVMDLVRNSVRLDKNNAGKLCKEKAGIDSGSSSEGAKKRAYADLLKNRIADNDSPAGREGVAFVVYHKSNTTNQESFMDSLGDGATELADFELLLEQAAFHRYNYDRSHSDYERSDISGFISMEHLMANISPDGKRVLVLEGDPSADFHIKTYSPNTKADYFVRQSVTVFSH